MVSLINNSFVAFILWQFYILAIFATNDFGMFAKNELLKT